METINFSCLQNGNHGNNPVSISKPENKVINETKNNSFSFLILQEIFMNFQKLLFINFDKFYLEISTCLPAQNCLLSSIEA